MSRLGSRPQSPIFFFDLRSPYAWLVAEQLDRVFEQHVIWMPVFEPAINRTSGHSDWTEGPLRWQGMREVEEWAETLGLPSVQWPSPFPVDSARVMRVASYASSVDKVAEFSLAAFRHQFLAGQALSEWFVISDVVAKLDMNGAAALDAPLMPGTKSILNATTAYAVERGVPGVPAIAVGPKIFWGVDEVVAAGAEARRCVRSTER